MLLLVNTPCLVHTICLVLTFLKNLGELFDSTLFGVGEASKYAYYKD